MRGKDDFDRFMDSIMGRTSEEDRALDRSLTVTFREPLPHKEGAACVTVIRLESLSDPRRGAFATTSFWDDESAIIWPAQVYAQEHKIKPTPADLPNIMQDGRKMAEHWTRHHYAGWKDIAQLDMWMPTREQRALVYDVPQACVREYRVAKDRVLFGKHQVGFMLDFAEPVRQLSREEFVR